MKQTISHKQLLDHFEGKTNSIQKKQIEEWAREENNFELYYQTLAEWEKQNLQYTADLDLALSRHKERMEKAAPLHKPRQTSLLFTRSAFYKWAGVAAVLLLVVAGWFSRNWFLYKTYTTDYGQTLSLILSDGSQVVLNSNSSLRIPRFGFGAKTRETYLEGEAEFSVRHTADHQRFIVRTPRALDITVLGTRFTVLARHRATRVALSQGQVRLSYPGQSPNEQLLMNPGDLASLDHSGKIAVQSVQAIEELTAWKDHRFVFSATPLSEIAQMIEEVFGVKVEIPQQEVARMTVSGSFTARSAEDLVEILSEAAPLAYQKEKNKILIQSK